MHDLWTQLLPWRGRCARLRNLHIYLDSTLTAIMDERARDESFNYCPELGAKRNETCLFIWLRVQQPRVNGLLTLGAMKHATPLLTLRLTWSAAGLQRSI